MYQQESAVKKKPNFQLTTPNQKHKRGLFLFLTRSGTLVPSTSYSTSYSRRGGTCTSEAFALIPTLIGNIQHKKLPSHFFQ